MTVMLAQHRDSIGPMARVISSPTLTQMWLLCWAGVVDGGPTLSQVPTLDSRLVMHRTLIRR